MAGFTGYVTKASLTAAAMVVPWAALAAETSEGGGMPQFNSHWFA